MNFNIDPSSGVLSVESAIDREEMNSNVISVSIKVLTFESVLSHEEAADRN